jgi:K+-sensing histidine kinase KdpD
LTGTISRSKSSRSARIWAGAAHDLRQPVQAMLLQLPVLDVPSSRAERKRAVRRIEIALLSLQDMLELLASMARIEAGLQDIALQACPLDEPLVAIARQLGATAQARGVGLLCRRTRAVVRSQPRLLAAAIRSLLLNAIALADGGEVAARCRRRGEDIVLEVGFTGGRLEAARGKSAFVALPRQRGAAAGDLGELGLGLELLEHLCRRLGHALEARHRAGRLQVLAIALPCATAPR